MADLLEYTSVKELLEHLKTRKVQRAYRKGESPPRHVIRDILNAAATAPFQSHDNISPWRFIATDDPALISDMARAVDPEDSGEPDYLMPGSEGYNRKTYFKNAPWVIVVLVKIPDPDAAPEQYRDTIVYDMTLSYGAALGVLMSAAHLAGLASGWVGSYTAKDSLRADALEKLLGVEDPWRVQCIVPIGYTAEKGKVRERPYAEMVEFR